MPVLGNEVDEFAIEEFLAAEAAKDLLRFSTAGSVDDGKSTLIGRLLYDSRSVYEDQVRAVTGLAGGASGAIDFALLTDGLRAEREQGITIDVAYRYFSTAKRKFIIADTPGHEQYTRNMATGASTADLAIILIDARKGILTQSRRHAYIASLLGTRHLVAAINKMDLVDFSEEVFRRISADFRELVRSFGDAELTVIPVSALEGDNVRRAVGADALVQRADAARAPGACAGLDGCGGAAVSDGGAAGDPAGSEFSRICGTDFRRNSAQGRRGDGASFRTDEPGGFDCDV